MVDEMWEGSDGVWLRVGTEANDLEGYDATRLFECETIAEAHDLSIASIAVAPRDDGVYVALQFDSLGGQGAFDPVVIDSAAAEVTNWLFPELSAVSLSYGSLPADGPLMVVGGDRAQCMQCLGTQEHAASCPTLRPQP